MGRKWKETLAAFAEGTLIIAVFLLIYLTMAQSPTQYVITVSFCATVLIFITLTYRWRRRVKQILRRITDEIASLPNDLSEKTYDHIQDETRMFYEELAHAKKQLDKKGRMRQELLDIVNTVASNMEFGKLLKDLMPKLNEATRSNCSAFYVINHSTHKLEIKHSVGFSKNIYAEFDLTLGEGLIGQAALKNDITIVRDIPEDTVYYIRSFLGKIKPRSLMTVPVISQGQPTGVLVCASIYDYTREDQDMIEMVRHYLGVAVNNGVNYEKTRRLTNELTFQNKLIQDQHEEMKKRLDEKTLLLNYLANYDRGGCLYALDTRGLITLWNKNAEELHGIAGQNAVGRHIDRVYEEYHWPALGKQFKSTLINGTHTESFWRYDANSDKRCYEIQMICMYNDQSQPIGVLNSVRETDT